MTADPSLSARYRRLPDGETELLVRFGNGDTSATVSGTRTRAFEKLVDSCASTILVRFRLGGAHPFFGRPLSALTDHMVPLEELWSEPARRQLASASEPDSVGRAALTSLGEALERADAYDPPSARSVRRAVQLIADTDVLPRVPRLAADLGVSERQLRRGFDQVIGLSPKHYLRVVRFQRALRAARATKAPDWAAIAEQAGYYDQAHMIGEFREMAGATPGALVA